jgi:hypothetical protein
MLATVPTIAKTQFQALAVIQLLSRGANAGILSFFGH